MPEGQAFGKETETSKQTPGPSSPLMAEIPNMTGSLTFGQNTVQIEIDLNGPGTPAPSQFELYGASNNEDPSSNTQALASEVTYPARGTMGGSAAYIPGDPFTVQVTFGQGGPRKLAHTFRADQTQPGRRTGRLDPTT